MKKDLETILGKHYQGDVSALQDILKLLNPKPSSVLFKELKGVYLEYFYNLKGEAYYWTAKDAGNIKHLVKKIQFKIKERQLEENEELIIRSFEHLLKKIDDKWILDNLSIAIINSKFNEIITKNGQDTSNQLRQLISNKHGN